MLTTIVNEGKTQVLQRISPSDAYIQRVKAIKPNLPKNYRAIILSNYPEYNSVKGGVLIQNVVAMRTADVLLTEILEKIAKGDLALKDKSE
jgi:hypothetical protein